MKFEFNRARPTPETEASFWTSKSNFNAIRGLKTTREKRETEREREKRKEKWHRFQGEIQRVKANKTRWKTGTEEGEGERSENSSRAYIYTRVYTRNVSKAGLRRVCVSAGSRVRNTVDRSGEEREGRGEVPRGETVFYYTEPDNAERAPLAPLWNVITWTACSFTFRKSFVRVIFIGEMKYLWRKWGNRRDD